MHPITHPRGRKARVAALLALSAPGLVLASLALPPAASAAAALPAVGAVVRDGSSMANAAASCFEIKQVKPTATNGVYWLQTDLMDVPEQFYCDQERDGGGWLLIGRGRQGWTTNYNGQGTTAEVRSDVDTAAGFAPKQLGGELVTQLLGGTAPQDLTDGYRLRRANNTAGTSWQSLTFKITRAQRFSWGVYGSASPVNTVKLNGTAVNAGTANTFGSTPLLSSADGTVTTPEQSGASYTWGFAYNKNSGGSTSATSFVYSTGSTRATPMTQFYVRPRLTAATENFAAIPDTGSAVKTKAARAQSGSLTTVWGVATRMGGGTNENYTEAQAFAESSGYMFVGGNFRYVQRDANGTDRAEQPYLAAFDVTTREWISTIRPTFNGQIKTLAALPGDRLAVGGEFNIVNGVSAPGFVVLDAKTGQVNAAWKLTIENNAGTKPVMVRSASVQGNWLYLGGTFTHFQGSSGAKVYSRNAARVNVNTGMPDKTWTPQFNGAVYSLTQAAGSNYVFAAGYFAQDLRTGQGTAKALARIDAGAGAQVANWVWDPSWPGRGYLWAWDAVEKDGVVWIGAIEHIFRSYDATTLVEKSSNITLPGGDFQDVQLAGNVVYASCHCDKWNYSGGRLYANPQAQSYETDHIDLVGAWDTSTGLMVQDFQPKYKGTYTQGVWAMATDSLGNIWVGGDLTRSAKPSGAMQFSGGFATYAARDVTPPAAPTNGKATRVGAVDTLTWTGSAGAKTYQVLRNDRVVATTAVGTGTVQVPATDGARYFVRAADAEGNLSASTALIALKDNTPVDPCAADPQAAGCAPAPAAAPAVAVMDVALIDAGSTWTYASGVTSSTAWATPAGSLGKTTGKTPIGYGADTLKTKLGTTEASGFRVRKDFTVTDPASLSGLTISTRADDGIVVWLNGTKLKQTNVKGASLTPLSKATTSVTTAKAFASPVTIAIDKSQLRKGTNTLAVQVLPSSLHEKDTSFDLSLKGKQTVSP
ncbi:MAG: fibrinogen [Arthrobacter sp.]|jgi:hypothetical protein|nr:fibrinogen [Arthrobacter sp.]